MPKGVYIRIKPVSEETRRKLGNALSEQWKKGLRKPFWLGKKHTEEYKRRMSEAVKGEKNGFYKRHHSEETKKKISLAKKGVPLLKVRGEGHYLWKGGVYPINERIRDSLKYKVWRRDVFERDNYTCIWCGAKTYNGLGKRVYLQADHILPFSRIIEKLKSEQGIENLYEKAMGYDILWDINNGRTLCKPCHYKTNSFGINNKYEIRGK